MENKKQEEQFFCRMGEGKNNSLQNSVFYNMIVSTDLLYNLKSFFPIEKRFIVTIEKKLKREKEMNIEKYGIFMPKLNKKKLNPDDITCYVCNSPDYFDQNQIVFCSTCNISVHQSCYELYKIPKDDWVCELCEHFGKDGKFVRCALCNCRGGALKKTQLSFDNKILQRNNPGYCQYSENAKLHTEKFDWQTYLKHNEVLLYNSYSQTYKFTEEELRNEPYHQNAFMHASCILWQKKLEFKNNTLKNLDKFKRNDFINECRVCKTSNGLTI